MGVLEDLQTSILSVSRLNNDGVPSASIAVFDKTSGKICASVITNGNENPDTVYQACSISKAITGLAVAKLVDLGRMSYNTKVVDHVPQDIVSHIVESDTAHLMQHVTVQMLLSHTSGLSQHGFTGYRGALPTYDELFSGRPPSNTPRIRFLSFPGSQTSYSGGGYTLLQLLLEELLDMPFNEIMEQIVLRPLDMTRSRYGDLAADDRNYAKAHYTAYTLGTEVERGYFRFVELAAAGLWTTPTDLLKAVGAVQDSLHNDGSETFLSREVAMKMLTKVNPKDSIRSRALGWSADETFFAHSGDNDPGYNTYVCGSHGGVVNPNTSSIPVSESTKSNRICVAVMTNSSLGFDTINRIVGAIFYLEDCLRYPRLPSFGSMTDFVPYPAPEGSSIDDRWKDWIGTWSDGWEILNHEGNPTLAFGSIKKPMRLRPAALSSNLPSGTRERMFVVPPLEIAIRFTEEEGQKTVKIVQEREQTLLRLK